MVASPSISPQISHKMDKQQLVQKIIAKLGEEAETFIRAARASHAEATHEQSKADNKYDTRGLEAAYLARGQSRQLAEVENSIEELRKLRLRNFSEQDAIDLGALVQLGSGKTAAWYFLAPRAGGTEIEHEGQEITVITPSSPLGQQLYGQKRGHKIKLPAAREVPISHVA